MREKLIRFKIVKNNLNIEAYLDDRLSFKDNFELLTKICDSIKPDYQIFDPNKKIFLNNDVSISTFNINYFIVLHLL